MATTDKGHSAPSHRASTPPRRTDATTPRVTVEHTPATLRAKNDESQASLHALKHPTNMQIRQSLISTQELVGHVLTLLEGTDAKAEQALEAIRTSREAHELQLDAAEKTGFPEDQATVRALRRAIETLNRRERTMLERQEEINRRRHEVTADHVTAADATRIHQDAAALDTTSAGDIVRINEELRGFNQKLTELEERVMVAVNEKDEATNRRIDDLGIDTLRGRVTNIHDRVETIETRRDRGITSADIGIGLAVGFVTFILVYSIGLAFTNPSALWIGFIVGLSFGIVAFGVSLAVNRQKTTTRTRTHSRHSSTNGTAPTEPIQHQGVEVFEQDNRSQNAPRTLPALVTDRQNQHDATVANRERRDAADREQRIAARGGVTTRETSVEREPVRS